MLNIFVCHHESSLRKELSYLVKIIHLADPENNLYAAYSLDNYIDRRSNLYTYS